MTVVPTYIQDTKRWRYWALNDKLGPASQKLPQIESRVVFNTTADPVEVVKLIEEDDGYKAVRDIPKPFLTTEAVQLHLSDATMVVVNNDPVNMIDNALSITTVENQMTEASRMVGVRRLGVKRNILHLGGTPGVEVITDLENASVTTIPLFPPLPTDFDNPEDIQLITTRSGYKEYIKGSHQSPWSALKAIEATGHKVIIYDGADGNFERNTDISTISATDSKNVKVDDIETILNAALSGVHANLGTFLPAEKAWSVINIPGQSIIESNDTKFSIRFYNATFATLVNEFSIAKVDGKITMGDATTEIALTPDGNIVLKAGSTTATLNKNGAFDVS